jgi:hypothetical protein
MQPAKHSRAAIATIAAAHPHRDIWIATETLGLTARETLRFLCCCAPPYAHDDTYFA